MADQITIDQRNFKYDYYSGANIGLFVGANQITNAVGFEMSLQQNKTPVYGYASSLFDGVANGVVQVSGVLWMNFTQAQLMSAFVANNAGAIASQIDLGKQMDMLFSSNSVVPEDFQMVEQLSEDFKNAYWGESTELLEGQNLEDPTLVLHARPDQHLKGFDIFVTYGVPFQQTANTNSTQRIVKDVRIVGFGQTISIDGEPVIETYPFIAREVF